MATRARILAALAAVVAVGALPFGARAIVREMRLRSARRALADVRGCLVGAPLAEGETVAVRLGALRASEAVAAADPAPTTAATKKGATAGATWPSRCAVLAYAAASSNAVAELAPEAASAADSLARALDVDTSKPAVIPEPAVAAVLAAGRSLGADGVAAPTGVAPAPAPMPLGMPAATLATIAKTPPAPAARFVPWTPGELVCRQEETALAKTLGEEPHDGACVCDAGAGARVLVAQRRGRVFALGYPQPAYDDLSLAFWFDAGHGAFTGPVPLEVHGHEALAGTAARAHAFGTPTVSCRAGGVAIAWAEAALGADDRAVYAIRRARCDAHGCTPATTLLGGLGTARIGMGMSPRIALVDPPLVADLGSAVAVVWRVDSGALVARVAPFESLSAAPTVLLDPVPEHVLDDARVHADELVLHATAVVLRVSPAGTISRE